MKKKVWSKRKGEKVIERKWESESMINLKKQKKYLTEKD